MADQPAEDPLDLGDTSEEPIPRNPDGTFAPRTATVDPSTPAHPDYIVRQAKELGFEDSDIKEMTPAVLNRAIVLQMRQQIALRDQYSRERLVSEGQVRQPAPEPTPPPDDLGINDDDWDPKLVGALRKIHGNSSKEIKELKEKLAQREQADAQRELRQNTELLDDAFEALGPEYERFIGKGDGDSIKGTPEFKRRIALINEAGIDVKAVSPRRVNAQIKKAAETLYGPAVTKPATPADDTYDTETPPQRITKEQWANGGVARPTQRQNAAEPNGEAKAVKNLERRIRAAGGDAAPDSEITDGLLG